MTEATSPASSISCRRHARAPSTSSGQAGRGLLHRSTVGERAVQTFRGNDLHAAAVLLEAHGDADQDVVAAATSVGLSIMIRCTVPLAPGLVGKMLQHTQRAALMSATG